MSTIKKTFEFIINFISTLFNKFLLTESQKKYARPLAISTLFFTCCCCFIFALPNNSTPSNTAPTINPESAMLTAWAYITQTAQALPTNTQSPSTNTPPPTETPTLQPVSTSTLASTSNIPTCIPPQQPQIATVVEVIDGDTIRVRLQDGLVYSIRYIGIDTPESTSAQEFYGKESSAKNSELVLNKEVLLFTDTTDKDRYGRLLRYVIVGDIFVNQELVAQGYATSVSYPPDTACQLAFTTAENTATTSGLGFWAQPTPTLPPIGGQEQVCVCSGNAYNCGDFNTRSSAQACYNYCIAQGAGDVHRLDANSDGQACESLP